MGNVLHDTVHDPCEEVVGLNVHVDSSVQRGGPQCNR